MPCLQTATPNNYNPNVAPYDLRTLTNAMLLQGGLGAVSTANDTTIRVNFVGLRCSIKRRHEATFFTNRAVTTAHLGERR